jgi:hypothetical protein
MNSFVIQNFNRIFQRDYTPEHIEEKAEKGSTSEKLILKVLNDMYYSNTGVSFYELWSICSDDLLKRLADTPHVYKEV